MVAIGQNVVGHFVASITNSGILVGSAHASLANTSTWFLLLLRGYDLHSISIKFWITLLHSKISDFDSFRPKWPITFCHEHQLNFRFANPTKTCYANDWSYSDSIAQFYFVTSLRKGWYLCRLIILNFVTET